jgi:hypothetical protein
MMKHDPMVKKEMPSCYGFIRLETLEGNLGDRPEPIPMFLSLKQTAGYSN